MNASEKQTGEKTAEGAATKPVNKPKRRNDDTSDGRKGTKTAKVLALLRRPAGASLAELREATGWQPHSVRGFLSGALKKKMGLRIDSVSRGNGELAYRLDWK